MASSGTPGPALCSALAAGVSELPRPDPRVSLERPALDDPGGGSGEADVGGESPSPPRALSSAVGTWEAPSGGSRFPAALPGGGSDAGPALPPRRSGRLQAARLCGGASWHQRIGHKKRWLAPRIPFRVVFLFEGLMARGHQAEERRKGRCYQWPALSG